jgi:hypothetical protein
MALVGAVPIVCPSVLSVYLMRWWFQCGALDGSFFFLSLSIMQRFLLFFLFFPVLFFCR